MADDTLLNHFKSLPTPEDLDAWEEEHARMGVLIKNLTEKREQLGKLIQVGAAIYGGKEVARRANTGRGRSRKGSWLNAIAEIVKANPTGISYDRVREALPEPFASMIVKDPHTKSFYGAMRRLDEEGTVVRYRSHLFTPEGHLIHLERVANGEIPDVEGHDYRGSPMSDALKAFLLEHPRSSAATIKRHLIARPEFLSLKRNTSAIYNVLKRLKDRDEIAHHEDGTYSLVSENEAPDGSATGASETGEGATSPIESQPTLRLIG